MSTQAPFGVQIILNRIPAVWQTKNRGFCYKEQIAPCLVVRTLFEVSQPLALKPKTLHEVFQPLAFGPKTLNRGLSTPCLQTKDSKRGLSTPCPDKMPKLEDEWMSELTVSFGTLKILRSLVTVPTTTTILSWLPSCFIFRQILANDIGGLKY